MTFSVQKIMELECAKYGEKMDSAAAACRHSGDYCQYRKSCMIHFMEREKKGSMTEAAQAEKKDGTFTQEGKL